MKKSLNTKQNGFLKISIIQKAQKWTETAKINKKIDWNADQKWAKIDPIEV